MSISEQKHGSLTEQLSIGTQSFVIRAYSLLGSLSLGIFGVLHIVSDGKPIVGYLELAGAAIFLINLFALKFTRGVNLAKNVLILNVLLFMIVMLVSGGTENTGIYWFFVFPIAAFFLGGKRSGLWWMTVFILAVLVTWGLSVGGAFEIPYDAVTLRQLLISLIVVSSGIYAYQYSRERLESERRTSQEELHGERVKSDVIVQHIDEGIVATDVQGRVTFMNQTAEKILGWRFSDIKGRRFVEIIPMIDETGRTVSIESRPLYRSLKNGGSITTTAQYRAKDGRIVPVSVTGTSIELDGKVIGGIGTFRDVTEEQDTARAKSEFVTLASHQLRTPISAISWMSELLLNGDTGKLSAEQKEHIDAIYTSSRRMANLVNEMLIVSSLELRTMPVVPEKTDVAKLSSDIIKEQLAERKELDRHIIEQYDHNLSSIPCDPEVLRHILRNLLTNALKYTPKDGRITFSITADYLTRVRPDSEGSIVMTVSDTGFGIPAEATDKIFTKFFRAQNIKPKDTDGTGLGLYIVKALLDYVGGSVSFTSREGEGTTFTVLLPLEGMAEHMPEPGSVGAASRRSVMRGTAHV